MNTEPRATCILSSKRRPFRCPRLLPLPKTLIRCRVVAVVVASGAGSGAALRRASWARAQAGGVRTGRNVSRPRGAGQWAALAGLGWGPTFCGSLLVVHVVLLGDMAFVIWVFKVLLSRFTFSVLWFVWFSLFSQVISLF